MSANTGPKEVLANFLDQAASKAPIYDYGEYYDLFHGGGVPGALVEYIVQHTMADNCAPDRASINRVSGRWAISALVGPQPGEPEAHDLVNLEWQRRNLFGRRTSEHDILRVAADDQDVAYDLAIESRKGARGSSLYLPVLAAPEYAVRLVGMGNKPIYGGTTTGLIEAGRLRVESPIAVAGFMRVATRTIRHLMQAVETV